MVKTTTSVDLQRLQKMPEKKKHIVCGYIREMSSSSEYETPITISELCLLFYTFEYDEWDKKWIGTTMNLDDDKRIITLNKNGGFSTSFLSRIAEYGYHEWKFRIISCEPWGGYLRIGIWGLQNQNDKPPNNTFFTNNQDRRNKYYAFDITQGTKYQYNHIFGNSLKYGIKCNKKDMIIDMILNFHTSSLKFKIDGIDHGKSHTIQPGQYRACVCMFNPGDSVQLLTQ